MIEKAHIACFFATSGHSGVDRVVQNLLPGMAAAGHQVDLLKIHDHGPYLPEQRPKNLRIIEFNSRHVYTALTQLVGYLRRERPSVLLSDKDRVNRTAILANTLAGGKTRLVVRSGTTVSINLASRSPFDRLVQRNSMRYLYRKAEAILMPSEGAADDFAASVGMPRNRISVVPSPIITPRFQQLLEEPLDHPWFQPGEPKVILGVGELCSRKDFSTLIRAFARLRSQHACRLLILGEGRARTRLEKEVRDLQLEDCISLPGFTDNPYPYMKRAELFALTSRWEGMPVVLIEALAAGTTAVATDCPSGPRELLQHGRIGPLVPPGDVEGLSRAMAQMLDNPPPASLLRQAVSPYTLHNSVSCYLIAMGLPVLADG